MRPYLFGRNFGQRDAIGMLYSPESGLYYPALDLLAVLGKSAGVAQISFVTPILPIPHPADYVEPTHLNFLMSVNIDGYTCTQPCRVEATPGTVVTNETLSNVSASYTMTPSSYWPYQGVGRVALWDSVRGQPATNPATGAPFTYAEIVGAAM